VTTKRKTKTQREAEQINALFQRIHDIYSGAIGQKWPLGEQWATAEELPNIIWACKEIFGPQQECEWPFSIHSISHFNTPESACDHLFTAGYRA